MNVAVRSLWTLDEFLAWEARQELRWEFDGFAPVAMTGGTARHEMIGGTLRAVLRQQLHGKPCRVWGPTLKIEVNGRIRYPDAFVSCTPVTPQQTVVTDPAVVFEVLSPSTSFTDRISKLREYGATPSIQHYVILEQDSIAAAVFTRVGRDLVATGLVGDDLLALPEIGVEIALSAFYADTDVQPPDLNAE